MEQNVLIVEFALILFIIILMGIMIFSHVRSKILAKKNKDYETADRIRAELFDKGVRIIDGRDKTTYEII